MHSNITYEVWLPDRDSIVLSTQAPGEVAHLAALAVESQVAVSLDCRVMVIPHKSGMEVEAVVPLRNFLEPEQTVELPVVETSEETEQTDDTPAGFELVYEGQFELPELPEEHQSVLGPIVTTTVADLNVGEPVVFEVTQDMTQPITPEAKRRARKGKSS